MQAPAAAARSPPGAGALCEGLSIRNCRKPESLALIAI